MTTVERKKLDLIFSTTKKVQATLQQFNGKVEDIKKHEDALQDTVNLMLKSLNRLEKFQEEFQLKDNWMFELATQIGVAWKSDFELFKKDVLLQIENLEKIKSAESK